MPESPSLQAAAIVKDLSKQPLPSEHQDKCEHEMWLEYIPSGMAKCRKCGFSRPITKEEWDNF